MNNLCICFSTCNVSALLTYNSFKPSVHTHTQFFFSSASLMCRICCAKIIIIIIHKKNYLTFDQAKIREILFFFAKIKKYNKEELNKWSDFFFFCRLKGHRQHSDVDRPTSRPNRKSIYCA